MVARESKSLTLALLNINTAKVYLEDVRVDFPAMARRMDQWINRLSFVVGDALAVMTPSGREVYRREITNGDPLQFEHIFQLLASMSPEQRSLIEKAAEGILKGEIEIIES